MYTCNICNYETDVRTAIYNHNKTKKHIVAKEFYDKKNKNEKDKEEQIKLLNSENEKLKQKLIEKEREKQELAEIQKEKEKEKQELAEIQKEKQIELLNKDKEIAKLETKVEIYKELSEKGKTINNNNKIVINNNLSYVNKHFENAPPLQKMTNFVLNGIDLNDDTKLDNIVDQIIYAYNNNCLHKLIGDHIIKHYKKDNLQQQSFHAIDISRRKYLVKLDENLGYLYDESSEEIDNYNPNDEDNKTSDSENEEYEELKNNYEKEKKKKEPIVKNKSKWINDNEGVKLSYLLYEPFIRKIMRQIKKKIRNYNIEIKKNRNKIPTMDEIKKYEALTSIKKDIDTNKLKTNINTYIGPHFGLVKE